MQIKMKMVSRLSVSKPPEPMQLQDGECDTPSSNRMSTSSHGNHKSGSSIKRLLSFRKFSIGTSSNNLKQLQQKHQQDVVMDYSSRTSTSSLRLSEIWTNQPPDDKEPISSGNPSGNGNHHNHGHGVSRSERRSMIKQQRANMKLLHVCRKHPRMQDVMSVLEKHPESLFATNGTGQKALHVAAAHGVNAEVIIYLVGQDPQAASVVDHRGKLPLHYVAKQSHWRAADGCCFLDGADVMIDKPGDGREGSDDYSACDDSSDDRLLDPMYKEMVKAVAKAYPEALCHEDLEGCNPIEYALMNDASLDVIKILQRTSVKSLRRRADPARSSRPILNELGLHAVAGRSA